MTAHHLVGTWRLVSCEFRRSDGRVTFPWGADATGYIIYTENGYMAVTVMSANRVKFTAGDLIRGTASEKAVAAETYLSYCGKYETQENRVIHHIQACSFPNWTGVDQERFVELIGNQLTLTTPPILAGGAQQVSRIVWERV